MPFVKFFALIGFASLSGSAAFALELASYDSAGKLTGLIHDGTELDVRAQLVVRFEGGPEVPMQPHDQRSPITREGVQLKWRGTTSFPNGAAADFDVHWTESGGALEYRGGLVHHWRAPLSVESVDYVIDVPRDAFVGGALEFGSGRKPIKLSPQKSTQAFLHSGSESYVRLVDAAGNWTLRLEFPAARTISVADHWDDKGRTYRIRVPLHAGLWPAGTPLDLGVRFTVAGNSRAAAAVVKVDPARPRYEFDGFGANYCWGTDQVATKYLLETLKLAWSRHELKAIAWDRAGRKPDAALTEDFKRIEQIHKAGVPWIISAWRVPERFYVDPNQKPPGSFGRQIAENKWEDVIDLFGSYLLYLKQHHRAEPDLFSFNEPDLGVDIGLSPEKHREMTKRIGARLRSLGLKTKILLGDTANPRSTHEYILPTAADPQAMQYVGAISFHSWGNGSAEQYRAWGDAAEWLNLPLLVGEAGVDPGAYRNRNYDSYDYGLRELEQVQSLLRHARPRSSLYWQFTQDYGLVRVGEGGEVQPTGRYWMMKHLTNLTPFDSQVLESASDQPDVLVSAFGKGQELVVHIANLGASRSARIEGLPAGQWRSIVTTEQQGWQESNIDAQSPVSLPARSITTWVRTR